MPAPPGCEVTHGEPAVVPASHTAWPEPSPMPAPDAVQLRWSEDGLSVAAFIDARLAGFIAHATGPGYSTGLRLSGAYGNVLDEALYAAVFGHQE